MLKFLKHAVILAAVFVLGLLAFSRMMYHETSESTTDLAEATLPLVHFVVDGVDLNELHGYTVEMDATTMRDAITPVTSGGTLSLCITSCETAVDALSYEIRSLDTERLVQQSEAVLVSEEEALSADLDLANLLTEGEEYLLIIKITISEQPVYYYTRIIEEEDSAIGECISFVREFHDLTLQSEGTAALAPYLEPSASADNSTLQTVTIENSLSQICWGSLEGEVVGTPVLSLKEINDDYNVLLMTYLLAAADEEGEEKLLFVEEYYRVRPGTEKMYLLDFERTVETVFNGAQSAVSQDALLLGLREKDVEYVTNETGSVVCFLQGGALWSYNISSGRFVRVFGFYDEESLDNRALFAEHDMKIVRVGESGSVDFFVYGYMNRGDHEGEVGISVCHYDSATNTVEEQLFVPFNVSYQWLCAHVEPVYVSEAGLAYIRVGAALYEVDLESLSYALLLEDITEETVVFTEDGRYVAWTKGSAYAAETLYVMDLETGTTQDVAATADCYIRPLAFLGTDCVWGLAKEENCSEEEALFAMDTIVIADVTGDLASPIKTVDMTETLVIGAAVEENSLLLSCVEKVAGQYEAAGSVAIYSQETAEETVAVETVSTSVFQRQVSLVFSRTSSGSVSLLTPKLLLTKTDVTVSLPTELATYSYYIYARGRLLLGTDSVTEAVNLADEEKAVVLDATSALFWRRGMTEAAEFLAELTGAAESAE